MYTGLVSAARVDAMKSPSIGKKRLASEMETGENNEKYIVHVQLFMKSILCIQA